MRMAALSLPRCISTFRGLAAPWNNTYPRFSSASALNLSIKSTVFPVEEIRLADRTEQVVRGSRDMFPRLSQAFQGIKQVGLIGWGSQGPAQAQNLRESLDGTGIVVKVGLRENSASRRAAEAVGFTEANGTLGEMFAVMKESDLVILLIADAAIASHYKTIFASIRPGAYLGLSHGYLLGHLKNEGMSLPPSINVIGVCPKGMGPSVRRLYVQGAEVNGSGINSSFAVEQDVSGRATDLALGWAVAIGSPVIFPTTLTSEYVSDIFGERGILLGAVYGICEVLYRHFLRSALPEDEAYRRSVECITGPITKGISTGGILSVVEAFHGDDRETFENAYAAAYRPAMSMLTEIYDEVVSGREIASVNNHVQRSTHFPIGKIGASPLWRTASSVRSSQTKAAPLDPTTAGIYLATMIAQCDLLILKGHPYTEVVNESIIEAVDSLNPYMAFMGVSYMVDNCSLTARLGARKWGPRFDYVFQEETMPALEHRATGSERSTVINELRNHKVHQIMETCLKLRPPVDIVPQLTHLG